jgi:hypothetical protein
MFTKILFIRLSRARATSCAWSVFTQFRTAFICLLTVCLLCGLQVSAQVNTGTLSGQVEDASGAVVPGATLTVAEQTIGYSRQVKTDSDGNYMFPELPIGQYTVTVESNGFETQRGTATINVGFRSRSDFHLSVDRQARRSRSRRVVLLFRETMPPSVRWSRRTRYPIRRFICAIGTTFCALCRECRSIATPTRARNLVRQDRQL